MHYDSMIADMLLGVCEIFYMCRYAKPRHNLKIKDTSI